MLVTLRSELRVCAHMSRQGVTDCPSQLPKTHDENNNNADTYILYKTCAPGTARGIGYLHFLIVH
jgi:hypothetical protein